MEVLTIIDHGVHAALRKYSRFAGSENFRHKSSTVLLKHICCRVAFDCNDVICCTWVVVRWEHGTRAKIEHCHCECHEYCY